MSQRARASKAVKPLRAPRRDPLASSKRLLELIQGTLNDHKAEEVVVIDLNGKSDIADFMVIATGRSHRHVAAMGEHLRQALKTAIRRSVSVEGAARADWILIDGGDVIVHLFRPEVREFYGLEKMWAVDFSRAAGS